ncbi:DUF722 domain-containing protein [Leuconostoc suionicum]|uniref:DUF722 domain-containing protein n=1 Tax=Leuconostoc gasicomitatum TaxID=115778 RepID=A0A9Q3XT14_9LACO|nr:MULTISPECIES: DUF722 domain-containing protein [Leuconostoc]MBZ5962653.1 DUF722 domain-containing protein [Leuconostoc gasicomitatum]MDI6498156.1 DUF722 domain-containing protein [Leuconostoc suionicum]MDI6500144.1 DUF722 domain-containing protein [Leuconostoc suionicum]MDI6502265.1 DUF722 domain-containing protein [Leuconostoc suionicum]MDI6614131.1 DUF722 domain-containing protein [Leuconostoc suionicum]
MADKTDELLTNYYSGVIDMKILLRRSELQWQPHDDDNIGGGRAINKVTRPLDDLIAKYEADSILHELTKQRDAIKRLETTFSEETKQIVQMHYDRRERLSWVVISLRMNLSERTCRTYQKTFKDSVAQTFNELDIAV